MIWLSLLILFGAVLLYALALRLWAWGLGRPSPLPSRIELKWCSTWCLFPPIQRTISTHKTKRFWLVHFPWLDLWVHFEEEAR